MFIDLITNAPE